MLDKVITPALLSLARAAVGFLFMLHGISSLFGVFGKASAVAFPAWPSWWAAAIQLVGGGLVLVGLGTRWAALLCSGSMAYAYFVVHQPTGLLPIQNGGVSSALYCWFFLVIALIGPGKYAVDTWLAERRSGAAEQSSLTKAAAN